MMGRSSSPSRSHAPDRGEGRSSGIAARPGWNARRRRPDGCPRLLQAAGFEPEEAVSLNSFRTARATSESFAGLTSLPVSFHFGPRREFITPLGGAAAAWPLAARAQEERMRRIGLLQGLAESDPEIQAPHRGLSAGSRAEGHEFCLCRAMFGAGPLSGGCRADRDDIQNKYWCEAALKK